MKETSILLWATKLYYKYSEAKTDKKNFIILHWWGGKSDSWLNVWNILMKQWYWVYIPDLPGFWKTQLVRAFSLETYADIIEDFSGSLGLDNIVLLGHSNGWAIATKLVLKESLDIQKLILNNSAWVRNDVKRKIKRLILKPFAIVLKTLKFFPFYNNIRSACYKLIGSRDFVNAEESNVFLKQSYLNVISNDLTKNFRELDIDTLLIRGEKDTYTPLSDGRHIRMNIKDSDLIIMDGKNHSIHLQSPLELSKILLEAAK